MAKNENEINWKRVVWDAFAALSHGTDSLYLVYPGGGSPSGC